MPCLPEDCVVSHQCLNEDILVESEDLPRTKRFFGHILSFAQLVCLKRRTVTFSHFFRVRFGETLSWYPRRTSFFFGTLTPLGNAHKIRVLSACKLLWMTSKVAIRGAQTLEKANCTNFVRGGRRGRSGSAGDQRGEDSRLKSASQCFSSCISPETTRTTFQSPFMKCSMSFMLQTVQSTLLRQKADSCTLPQFITNPIVPTSCLTARSI